MAVHTIFKGCFLVHFVFCFNSAMLMEIYETAILPA